MDAKFKNRKVSEEKENLIVVAPVIFSLPFWAKMALLIAKVTDPCSNRFFIFFSVKASQRQPACHLL